MNNWIDTSQIEWIVNVLCLQVDIPSEPEDDDDDDPDGRFAFKRKLGVEYLSVGILSLDAMDCLLFFFFEGFRVDCFKFFLVYLSTASIRLAPAPPVGRPSRGGSW